MRRYIKIIAGFKKVTLHLNLLTQARVQITLLNSICVYI